MNAKDNAVSADKGLSWKIEIPFQYAWVEASIHKIDSSSRDLGSFIEENFDGLCRVRFQEVESDDARCMRLLDAWQMRASCPFCSDGANQPLRSGSWVYVHDWHRDEMDTLSEEQEQLDDIGRNRLQEMHKREIDNPLNVEFIRDPLGHWGARDNEGLINTVVKWGSENAFGIRLLELREANTGQLRLLLPGVEISTKSIGVEGYFGGLYRCAHCGGMFAVVYRDREDPHRQGRYELLEEVDQALSFFIGRTKRMHDPTSDRGFITTMSAEIAEGEGLVSLKVYVAGHWHHMDFDTERGTIVLDGSSYVRKEFQLHALFGHPMFRSGLFGIRGLIEALRSKLPSLPDDVSFFMETFLGERDLLLLIAMNRFRGYPVEFYDDLMVMDRFQKVYPLATGLPRDCAYLPELYRMTGLPEKKSLKRALFNRPLVLYELLQDPDLPFNNVDILRRFFEYRDALTLIEYLNLTEHSCAGWRHVANAKGEDYLLRLLMEKQPFQISALSKLFEYAYAQPLSMDTDELFDLSSSEFSRHKACFKWQYEHPDMDIDGLYRHEPAQRELEWEASGYTFVLPRCPRDLVVAATDLHNCLYGYVGPIGDGGEATIMLMCKDEAVVGAVEIWSNKLVRQALATFNEPIESNESLNSVFVKWMDVKGLEWKAEDPF